MSWTSFEETEEIQFEFVNEGMNKCHAVDFGRSDGHGKPTSGASNKDKNDEPADI